MSEETSVSEQAQSLETRVEVAENAAQVAEVAAVAAVEAAATAEQIAEQRAAEQAAVVISETVATFAETQEEVKWTKEQVLRLEASMIETQEAVQRLETGMAVLVEKLSAASPSPTPALHQSGEAESPSLPSSEPNEKPSGEQTAASKPRRFSRL